MKIRQGMFRLWVVFSVLFVLVVGVVSYREIREEFHVSHIDYDAIAEKLGGEKLLPVDCGEVRGVATADYSVSDGACWYKAEAFRRLYPEYKSLSGCGLEDALYARVGRPRKHPRPWTKVAETAGVAFGVPLAVLTLACSLGWAFAGFRGSVSSGT